MVPPCWTTLFLSCLKFAVLNSLYDEIFLKPKQVVCLESMYLQNDVMCVLPTACGNSLVFHLLPMLLFARGRICGDLLCWKLKDVATAAVSSIVMVVSPLNSLMSDQVSRLYASGIRASVIDVNKKRDNTKATMIRKKILNTLLISVFAKRLNYVLVITI